MSEKTLTQQQIDALLAERRGYYPVCSKCSEDLIPHDGELCGACAKSELAAAEERGRDEIRRARSGAMSEKYTEWRKERDRLTAEILAAEKRGEERGRRRGVEEAISVADTYGCGEHRDLLLRTLRVLLAPRDSGKDQP